MHIKTKRKNDEQRIMRFSASDANSEAQKCSNKIHKKKQKERKEHDFFGNDG